MEKETKTMGTRDFLLKVLKEHDYVPDESEGGFLLINYGNEEYATVIAIDCNNESRFIRMIDYNWQTVNKWDIDKVTIYQAGANLANTFGEACVVYEFEDDDMKMSTVLNALFCEGFIEPFDYLRQLINDMICSKMRVENYVADRLKQTNQEETKGKEA